MDNVRKKRENDEGRRVCSFRVGKCQKKGWKRKKWNENFQWIFSDCKSDKGRKIEKLGTLPKKKEERQKTEHVIPY
jgi:hypothetical protein